MIQNKWIFVDVDGTITPELIEWCREAKAEVGMRFVLWSARGKEYAENVAEKMGCVDLFESIVSKPGRIFDDKGWGWIRYTKVGKPGSDVASAMEEMP